MNDNFVPTDKFKKEAKKLTKKYPSLKSQLSDLNPITGTSLSNSSYKTRIAIKRKGTEKKGGTGIITNLFTENKEVNLLTNYDKADLDFIDDKIITNIIEHLNAGQQ